MKEYHLSACLIIKNEAPVLAQCLESILPIADEIIIVDTGSTDQSLDIASNYTSKIFHFPWQDHFGLARNASIQYAQGQWILIIDADEVLPVESHAPLQELLATKDKNTPAVYNFLAKRNGSQAFYTRALFPNLTGFAFKGRVHESLRFKGEIPPQWHCPQIFFQHPISSPQREMEKIRYYLFLIQAELADNLSPEEQTTYFRHLADAHLQLQEPEAALTAFQKSYQAFHLSAYSRKDLFYLNLLKPLIELSLKISDDTQAALNYAQECVHLEPTLTEGWCYLAYLLFLNNHYLESLKMIEALFSGQKGPLDLRWQILLSLTQARCYLAQQDIRTGLELLKSLYLVHPVPEVKCHLFRAYLISEAITEALNLFSEKSETSCKGHFKWLLSQKVWTHNEKQTLEAELKRHELLN